jgi:hypothetical protein
LIDIAVRSYWVVEIRPTRRVGAGAGARDRGDQARELEGGTKLVALEMEIPLQVVVVLEPGKQAGAECVASADSIDDVDHRSGDTYFNPGADAKRSVGPQRHHDESGAARPEGTCG